MISKMTSSPITMHWNDGQTSSSNQLCPMEDITKGVDYRTFHHRLPALVYWWTPTFFSVAPDFHIQTTAPHSSRLSLDLQKPDAASSLFFLKPNCASSLLFPCIKPYCFLLMFSLNSEWLFLKIDPNHPVKISNSNSMRANLNRSVKNYLKYTQFNSN